MSSRTVSDEATRELMTDFYTFSMGSDDKPEAFKQARLRLKEKYPEPYF
jgi:CHAT domain-containing protein